MEKRRVPLIVFLIASILVLAGFSANEKAYAGNNIPPVVDELHCYGIGVENLLPEPPIQMILQDQFQNEPHELEEILEICNPVAKTTVNFDNTEIVNQQHWTVYQINTTANPVVIATVKITDQFHPNGFEVTVLDFADTLLVPTQKTESENGNQNFPNLTGLHYKCYELGPTNGIQEIFSLSDQFDDRDYVELVPIEICNPVEKFLDDGEGNFIFADGDNDRPEHYLCYDIFEDEENPNPDVSGSFSFSDQFLTSPADILFDEVLCTVAMKEIIGPVVGGINIPIDTSSLLLAGVQSISMWMIPVVIAGIGIGIFVIKRRK